VLATPREVEVEMREQVDLVQHDHVDGAEHHRVLQRLVLALRDRIHHRPRVGPDVELGRTHEIADVLDDDQVEAIERQAREARLHHHGVEVALAPEPRARVHECDVDRVVSQRVGVDARLDVALDDADSREAV